MSDIQQKVNGAIDLAAKQIRATIERDPGYYPVYTTGGKWRNDHASWTHWCEGFFPGMMWMLYRHTGNNDWRLEAEHYAAPLEPRQHDNKVHDLGFVLMSSYRPWLEASGDKLLQDVLVQAGRTMASRFMEKGRYLPSFLGPDSIFIDIMMNVRVIFYAAAVSGDSHLRDVAMDHCLTTRRVLVRGDGSTSHEGMYDLATGEFLRQTTQQGYRSDSAWSRGLAWALYGFGTAYRYVQDERLLLTAEDCAAFYVENTPSGVPPWDYDAPAGDERFPDTSAGAIAASGFFQLAELTGESWYKDQAMKIVEALIDGHLADQTPGWEGILKGGVYHLHKNLGVNESVSWGDYYFLEALMLAAGHDAHKWNT